MNFKNIRIGKGYKLNQGFELCDWRSHDEVSKLDCLRNSNVNAKLKIYKEVRSIVNQLIEQLQAKLFTGRLNLEARDGPAWTLYFRLGRLIWQAGGYNANERWRRHLSQYCSNLDVTQLERLVSPQENYREYCILAKLREQKLIEQQQLVNLITSLIAEVLFDIMQYIEAKRNGDNPAGQLSHTIVVGEVPGFLLTVIPTEEVLKQATQAWQEWRDAGLASYSPNLFPVIQQLELLQGQASSKQIISLVDGTKTLRGLGQKSGRDVLALTRFLMPLIKAGAIAFSPTPNLKKVGISKEIVNPSSAVNNSNSSLKREEDTVIQVALPAASKAIIDVSRPLVACVDDSPTICRSLEEILTHQGYRFVGIQESLIAILQLIKSKPDFIFLDLLMPKVNGYEICSQIRKTPGLKDVPVVILTGKDGIVDRMRAKLVGATDFLGKPVEAEKVLNVLHKYLTV